jgi:Na+-driven multidrug efflux pump
MVYNFGAAILRAVGDTKRPLIYLTIAGVVNVVLNLILVIIFHMNVAGVAIATVTSQAVSAVLVVICLMRSHGVVHLDLKELRIHKRQLIDIARVGLPAGLQGSLFSISNVLIQSSVNSFGEVVVAANSAGGNLEGFVYTSMNAIHQAALTFASQNLGAGKIKRVRRSVWVCIATVTVIGLVMGNLMYLCGKPLLSLYLDDPSAIDPATGITVLEYGMKRLSWMLPLYCLCGLMDVAVGSLRGVGYSVMPMIVSLTGACLFRVVWILTVFAANPTLDILYLSYPISWALTFSVHMLCYFFIARRKLARLEEKIAANA